MHSVWVAIRLDCVVVTCFPDSDLVVSSIKDVFVCVGRWVGEVARYCWWSAINRGVGRGAVACHRTRLHADAPTQQHGVEQAVFSDGMI